MNKFKVGDKVRCIEHQENNDLYFGAIHTIEEIDNRIVYVSGIEPGFFYYRLEKIKPLFKGNLK